MGAAFRIHRILWTHVSSGDISKKKHNLCGRLEKYLMGIKGLKAGCLPNIKAVQLTPNFLKSTKCQKSPESLQHLRRKYHDLEVLYPSRVHISSYMSIRRQSYMDRLHGITPTHFS
jgi:hypothetical protein